MFWHSVMFWLFSERIQSPAFGSWLRIKGNKITKEQYQSKLNNEWVLRCFKDIFMVFRVLTISFPGLIKSQDDQPGHGCSGKKNQKKSRKVWVHVITCITVESCFLKHLLHGASFCLRQTMWSWQNSYTKALHAISTLKSLFMDSLKSFLGSCSQFRLYSAKFDTPSVTSNWYVSKARSSKINAFIFC